MKSLSLFFQFLCFTLFLLFILPSCNNPVTEISNVSQKDETSTEGLSPEALISEPVTTEGIGPSCDWLKKREFECDGVTYITGLPTCNQPTAGKSVFCKKEYENNLQACLNDISPQTQKCRFEKIGRHIR